MESMPTPALLVNHASYWRFLRLGSLPTTPSSYPYLCPPTSTPKDPTSSHHCPSKPLSSPRYSKDSRTDPPLGGGSNAPTAASGAIPGVEAPPEAAPAITKGRSSYLRIASLQSYVSTAVSGQNRFLSSPRSRRKKPFSVLWSIEWVCALLAVGHGAAQPLFHRCQQPKKNAARLPVFGSMNLI
jgi:hypothetical protein